MRVCRGNAEFYVPPEIGHELLLLRQMRAELVKLHCDARRWITEVNSPNMRAAECRIGKVLAVAPAAPVGEVG